jgi:hypothetical protein
MKIYQIHFRFMDPSEAVGTIMAESPEEAIAQIKADLARNGVDDPEIISIEEVLSNPDIPADDLSANRTLN